jgi:uncharacterized membrane protein
MQNRFKSTAAWLTLLPVIILLGDAYGLWNVINMSSDTFTKLFTSILAVGTAFGIFNNPTDEENY